MKSIIWSTIGKVRIRYVNINDFNGLAERAKMFEGVRIRLEVIRRPSHRSPPLKREAG
jgi:hypothetical protein